MYPGESRMISGIRVFFVRLQTAFIVFTKITILAGLASIALCQAQQTITVRNAARQSAGLPPSNAVAPGSILDIQQLPPPRIIIGLDPSRISIEVRPLDSADTLSAPLLAAPLLSIWAWLPASTPLGPADVTLTIDGQASAPARILVTATDFGLFTQAGNGLGPAIAQNQDGAAEPIVNKLTNPVLPGRYVILWGTGLGSAASGGVTVLLGGEEIVPSYAGPAPGVPGVDQINFRVPDTGVPNGCYVSVMVKTGDRVSNEAALAKAGQPGACEHPFGLSAADLAMLDSRGQILFGTVHLQSDAGVVPGFGFVSSGSSQIDTASAQFSNRSAFEIGLLAQPLTSDEHYFGCTLAPPFGVTGAIIFANEDAGPALTLTGPDRTAILTGNFGLYTTAGIPLGGPSSDSPFFVPGAWKIEGPGGQTVPPFEASLQLPPVVRWTNRDTLTTLDRAQDQDIIWDPSGYSDTDVTTVSVALTRLAAAGSPAPEILCRAPATTGRLTIPAALLQAIPSPGLSSLRLAIAPRPNRRELFSLPLTDGSAARAFFDYSFSETISTQLR
jgi:uncharacterized protein (TIGR03437 family)